MKNWWGNYIYLFNWSLQENWICVSREGEYLVPLDALPQPNDPASDKTSSESGEEDEI